ncbi:MAG: PEP/pyruvate-binding domain-containing protein [Candidatus Zixiibacteriota bacterium]
MSTTQSYKSDDPIEVFSRDFFKSRSIIGKIGQGEIGGKAAGLAMIQHTLQEKFSGGKYDNIAVGIPKMAVLATDIYEKFIERNNLGTLLDEPNISDEAIARKFLSAHLPVEIVGDLRALVTNINTPLAIRSSSLLEDALYEPFAGVYATKMIPNNQPDVDTRFNKLVEAIKFVFASTYFRHAREYHELVGKDTSIERMAVIIQEVVGQKYNNSFYPAISGVARSYNFYPIGNAKPENGIVNLACGLGKTIVDGGRSWSYSPAFPTVAPPYSDVRELLDRTQTKVWAINMGAPPEYNPFAETEYLVQLDLSQAEYDGALDCIASTYNAQNDRIVSGLGHKGPRILDFSPILKHHLFPLNELLISLLIHSEYENRQDVEIEFAVDIEGDGPPTFSLLQIRPMVVSREQVTVTDKEMQSDHSIIVTNRALGNGIIDGLTRIVMVDPDTFSAKDTRLIAGEISRMNRKLLDKNESYLLIGFGRWGSSDSWLGIPVEWSDISGAEVIIEATLPTMNVELSQGSHFFHNLSSFRKFYLQVDFNEPKGIDWDWLKGQPVTEKTQFIRLIELDKPLKAKVDGRSGLGVIQA